MIRFDVPEMVRRALVTDRAGRSVWIVAEAYGPRWGWEMWRDDVCVAIDYRLYESAEAATAAALAELGE